MYTFLVVFTWQHRAISGNGRYRSKNHRPLKSNQSDHIDPSNRNLFRFVTRSHRHDMHGVQAFPHHLFALRLYPSIAALDDLDGFDLIPASLWWLLLNSVPRPRHLCRIYVRDYWDATCILVMCGFNIITRQLATSSYSFPWLNRHFAPRLIDCFYHMFTNTL